MLALTCSEPPGEVTHWTGSAVAHAVGISLRAVQRLRDAHRLKPHRLRTSQRSRDPALSTKVEDVVGLYMYPQLMRWCCSSTGRARSRRWSAPAPTVRSLSAFPPLRPTTIPVTAARRCLRPSTSWRALSSAAACSATETVSSSARSDAVEVAVPPGRAIHAILENVATHRHPKVRASLDRHPRRTFHLPRPRPRGSMRSGAFSALTRRRLRRGPFPGIVDLRPEF